MKAKKNFKNMKNCGINLRYLIRSITKNSDDYDEKYKKIKFNSDDALPLNKKSEMAVSHTMEVLKRRGKQPCSCN